MAKEKKQLIIIDSNSVIHRAFHALPALTTGKGEQVGAVYGFLLVFLKIVKEFKPDFIAACFDFPAPTFRHKRFKDYKAKRPPAPKELYNQIPIVKEILKAFRVPIFEREGFEADDIIGTIAKKFPQKQVFPKTETIILSGDLDTLQLINKNTKVYLLRRGVKNTMLYDKPLVREKYSGLNPDQLIDLRALKGDASDNIPGISGIGEKTAINLLKQFGTIKALYEELDKKSKKSEDVKPKIKNLLIREKEQAFLSKELAEIQKNVPVNISVKKSQWGKYDKEEVLKILRDLGFHTLIKRLSELESTDSKNKKVLRLW